MIIYVCLVKLPEYEWNYHLWGQTIWSVRTEFSCSLLKMFSVSVSVKRCTRLAPCSVIGSVSLCWIDVFRTPDPKHCCSTFDSRFQLGSPWHICITLGFKYSLATPSWLHGLTRVGKIIGKYNTLHFGPILSTMFFGLWSGINFKKLLTDLRNDCILNFELKTTWSAVILK